jgi:AcrR family transcriptional regulator
MSKQVMPVIDAQVERTRQHVFAHARELLAEQGASAVTYSALSSRARVTRQTLYRHWPTREALFVELVSERAMLAMPDPADSPEQVVGEFLRRLRDGMDEPANAAVLTVLVAQADRDAASSTALGQAVGAVRAALAAVIAASGGRLDEHDYARLCGPVIWQRFFARRHVSDELIDTLVRQWSVTRA